jgi:hypothetical protein
MELKINSSRVYYVIIIILFPHKNSFKNFKMWFSEEDHPKAKITISSQDGMNLRQEMFIHQKQAHQQHKKSGEEEPHPLYPVEKPHPNLKPMPPIIIPDTDSQQPKLTSLLIEKERSEEGALTLRGCCIVIAIIEMLLGLVNLTELTVDLDNWINHKETYVQHLAKGTLLSSVNLLSFTKSDFSFARCKIR